MPLAIFLGFRLARSGIYLKKHQIGFDLKETIEFCMDRIFEHVWTDLNLLAVIEINWVCRGLFCVGLTRVSIGKIPTL